MTDNLGTEKNASSLIITDLTYQMFYLIEGDRERVVIGGRRLESIYSFYVRNFTGKDAK